MAQPNYTLYPTFDFVSTAQTLEYHYANGKVYLNNPNNVNGLKRMLTTNMDLAYRATRLKEEFAPISFIRTPTNAVIDNLNALDEVWVNHNYVGNSNWEGRPQSDWENSWWYDVDKHREYRVYLVLSYNTSQLVGANREKDWYVKNAYIEYKAVEYNDRAGTFQFTSIPDNPVTVSGMVHFNSSNVTWPTMSVKLYQGAENNLPGREIATQTINRSSAVDEVLTVTTTLDSTDVSLNDVISLAAEVDGTSGQITAIAAPLTVQDYSLEVTGNTGTYNAGGPVMLGGLGQSMDVSDDCNPILNNVGGSRGNERVQIIEYSTSNLGSGSLTPSNLEEILASTARHSSVPESYYTSLAVNRNRYIGSKFTRTEINASDIPDDYQYFLKREALTNQDEGNAGIATPDILGNISAIDLQEVHLGYYSRIIDPYPTLNGKTAYFVKYLLNDQNAVQDPSLSELGRINFVETFKIRDINGGISQVQPVIQDRENFPELGELEVNSNIFKVGEFPYPILYSQNSANTFTENLPLSGSAAFFTNEDVDIDTYVNYAFTTTDSSPTNLFPIQQQLRDPINVPRTRLLPTDISGVGVNNQSSTIFNVNGNAIEFPSGTPLTDQYTITGTFTFYTSPLPRRVSRGISNPGDYAGYAFFTILRNGSNFRFGNMQLNVTGQRGVTQNGRPLNYAHPQNPMQLNSSATRRINTTNAQNSFRAVNGEAQIRLHTDIHQWGLATNGYPHHLGTNPNDGDRIKWEVSFTIPSSYVRPGDTFNFEFRNTRATRVGNIEKDDPAGEANPSWQRSIFPPIPVGNPDQPSFSLNIRGTQTQNVQADDLNNVNFPYWDKPPGTTNQIRLISEQLNNFYGGAYYQGNLPYVPGVNPDFPLATEPDFLQFGAVRSPWMLEAGDEFRFENDEEKVFTVVSIDNSGTQLLVTLDRELPESINLNFFLIRRYEEAPNIVILDQLKPYNNPPTGSSSPGILLPEFRIESLETNPDAVITNLIERNLIE